MGGGGGVCVCVGGVGGWGGGGGGVQAGEARIRECACTPQGQRMHPCTRSAARQPGARLAAPAAPPSPATHQRGNRAVGVCDEGLHVDVAVGDGHGVGHGHLAGGVGVGARRAVEEGRGSGRGGRQAGGMHGKLLPDHLPVPCRTRCRHRRRALLSTARAAPPRAHLVEGAHGGEAQHRLGGGEEELQHRDRGGQLAGGDVTHVADGTGRLKDHHLGRSGSGGGGRRGGQAARENAAGKRVLLLHGMLLLREHCCCTGSCCCTRPARQGTRRCCEAPRPTSLLWRRQDSRKS